ncbi:6-phosphogluconolactonase [Sphingobacterium griseoflavum]|uniref:6-phosphogluconolactonase n=1 Tax=Sphingobacterium griseoflavum TaxID=1474952 RepID=A0ABQ3HXE9_9SPHI|nr:6-phosphogluconolactonase [Sphingobacterium griseoflavum]GHE33964.1 6-phosphogluconolactonase [Sphingobacterium griseoflavum]
MVQQFRTKKEIFEAAAAAFIQSADEAVKEKGYFAVALTGGSSPIGLYELLASEAYKDLVDWSKVLVFWGDERWVPLNDKLSNAKMAYETLLNHVPVLPAHVFPMYADGIAPGEYARQYEETLVEKLGNDGMLDFILLGMGDDGHTASLFPETDVLQEQKKWVAAYYLTAQQMYRITLTAPFINSAKKIVVMAYGKKKAHALQQVLQGPKNPSLYPSQLLDAARAELIYMVDEEAAANLT